MFLTKMIDEKRRYRQYKARTQKLPANYRSALGAFEHYFMYFAPDKGDELLAMLEDLADLFDESAASGVSISAIVGDDPVEFAEAFRRNYPQGQWIVRQQERLARAIQASVSEEGAS